MFFHDERHFSRIEYPSSFIIGMEPKQKVRETKTIFSCVYAALYNGTKLVRMDVAGKRPVLFVGHFNEVSGVTFRTLQD